MKVVFIAQFPPPMNGLTYITRQLAQELEGAGHQLVVRNIASNVAKRGLTFHLTRIAKTISACAALLVNSTSAKFCYITTEGGFGLVYTLALASIARLCRYNLYLHHHSFNYISRRRALMARVIKAAGPDANHICLSSGMARELSTTYQAPLRTLVVSNAGFVADGEGLERSAPHLSTLRIGLLSNLDADKGLFAFLEILRVAKLQSLPIKGELAGPIAKTADLMFVSSLTDELGDNLRYLGPVYGEAKKGFFQYIDLFVFPTNYSNEAQPTVIFEALAYGVPVISFDRGCIREQVGDGGYVFDQDTNFVGQALVVLRHLLEKQSDLNALRANALRRFEIEKTSSRAAVANLFGINDPITSRVSR